MNLDTCLQRMTVGDPVGAQAALDACSQAVKRLPEGLYLQAQIFMLRRDFGAALPILNQLFRSIGDDTHIMANLGLCQLRLGQRPEAVKILRRALSTDPSDFESRYNLAVALKELGQVALAREEAEQAEAAARSPRAKVEASLLIVAIDILDNDIVSAEGRLRAMDLRSGSAYEEVILNFMIARGQATSALEHIRAIPVERRHEGIFVCANLCIGLMRDWSVGISFLRTYFSHLGDQPVFWSSLMSNLYSARDFKGVLDIFQEVPPRLRSSKAQGLFLKAQVQLKPLSELSGVVQRALREGSTDGDLIGFIYSAAMKQGDVALQSRCVSLLSRHSSAVVDPFTSLAIERDPIRLLRNSRLNFDALGVRAPRQPTRRLRRSFEQGPLRVGLVSADLRAKHAVGKLLNGLIPRFRLSRNHFVLINSSPTAWAQEVVEYVKPDDELSLLDLSDRPLSLCKQAILALDLDILIDLSGFTEHHLQPLLVSRLATVQVNWLGFPGTLASGSHDFIIGDSFVIPMGCERFYAERVVRLPCCYQPNDETRLASVAPAGLRLLFGLSARLVVGIFNAGHKLQAQNLLFWVQLLSTTSHLQMLILSPGKAFESNLSALLDAKCVDPSRVVFTQSLDYEDHMMRFQVCDFMLDTSPYGSHTTASEALWNGCPVFTVPGRTFASRVAGSLNHHAGLADLANFDSYASLLRAVQVLDSGDLSRLVELRGRLGQFNKGLPIFDSAHFFEHFEAALRRMVVQ